MAGITVLEDVYTQLQKEDINLQTKFSYTSPKTNGKSKRLSLGRIWFNLCLPEDYPLIDDVVDKKKLNEILYDIYEKYESSIYCKTLSIITKESFKIASIQPVSYDINSLILPQFINEKRKLLLNRDLSPKEFADKSIQLAQEYLDWLKENDSGVYTTIVSGSKGNIELLANIIIGRGSTVDIENNVEKPVVSSLIDGYTIPEYFQAAKVARKAFFTVAQGTAEPGALVRRIIYANTNIELVDNDCKSTIYLQITLEPDIANNFIGRYIFSRNKLIQLTNKNIDKYINKNIKLRSPIFCKSKGDTICNICYGGLGERIGSKHIAVSAAAALNNALVEGYNMKAKHATGVLKLNDVNFKKDIIRI